MSFYQRVGEVPPKRHTQFRRTDEGGKPGELYYEEMVGEEGFSSNSSLLYHRGVPSSLVDASTWELPDLTTTDNHPVLGRLLKPHALWEENAWRETDPVTGRTLLLGNDDVRLNYVVAGAQSPYYRNSVGDEICYLEAGSATVETVFGVLQARAGDYVILPRGTTHRWLPTGDEPLRILAIEANSHVAPPSRYVSRYGQFLENAPYCERDLHGPTEPLLVEGSDVEVLVKHRGNAPGGIVGSKLTYETHPFDVVGWDGGLYPLTFNIEDFEPITGRIVEPPPTHQVFEGDGFVVCNFVPRNAAYREDAVPLPYYHTNVDSDEVMFYVGGDYTARSGSGVDLGSITLHPGAYAHGPHPGSIEKSLGMSRLEETAVMVDTFRPLGLGVGGRASEDPAYAWTWSGRGPGMKDGKQQ
ncbi:homogentisate 1,2-dioxygenase [Epidermidibacterium keratini]|uniref:Homogentisate 1,2-dioxygenase n=1 Tax=Epidermidibacterium keratini TaxID=1891644 RepID=A0A7L4YMX3_9ACTN|nr:cupin domain-containing protein [Epidermidibacterium keratini]QHC00496.1 homogentisate 1,2-dioxygenase [Epidermidibacterium keratini]